MHCQSQRQINRRQTITARETGDDILTSYSSYTNRHMAMEGRFGRTRVDCDAYSNFLQRVVIILLRVVDIVQLYGLFYYTRRRQ